MERLSAVSQPPIMISTDLQRLIAERRKTKEAEAALGDDDDKTPDVLDLLVQASSSSAREDQRLSDNEVRSQMATLVRQSLLYQSSLLMFSCSQEAPRRQARSVVCSTTSRCTRSFRLG